MSDLRKCREQMAPRAEVTSFRPGRTRSGEGGRAWPGRAEGALEELVVGLRGQWGWSPTMQCFDPTMRIGVPSKGEPGRLLAWGWSQ